MHNSNAIDANASINETKKYRNSIKRLRKLFARKYALQFRENYEVGIIDKAIDFQNKLREYENNFNI